jgi:DNA-directed RNA polymerase specialized sigma24 family protein
VAEKATSNRGPDDAELLNKVRTGDATAFGILYQRHVTAVRRLARELVLSPAEADHLVAETFALVHDVTLRGDGPADAFRPYVLTALRRVAADQVRDWRVPTAGHPDPGEPLAPGAPDPDDAPIVRAFLSLPERWRAVLWHADIEGEPAAEIAPLLGVSAAGVADLRRSARDGLRLAIVRTYIARTARPECQPTAERLDEYERGALAEQDAAEVGGHVDGCADCAALCVALGGITAGLRDQVAPIFLGPAAAQYLLGSRDVIPAGPGTPPPAQTYEVSAAATGTTAGVLQMLDRLPRSARVGVAVAVAVCAVAAGAITAKETAHNSGTRNLAADSRASLDIKASATPVPSSQPAPTPTPRPKPTPTHHRTRRPAPASSTAPAVQPPKPSPTTAPPPQPTSSPPAAAQLSASVSLSGGHHFQSLSFQVNDTGNAATGQLTATITLPSDAFFGGSGRQQNDNGWSCQPTSSGASCQHAALAAGAQAPGTIFIFVGSQACGQPVQLAAASGSLTASAESGDIQCQ